MTSIKQDRVAGRIRQILSVLILREVADPRLQGLTITEVEIDPELMYARVYVNALGDEARQSEVMKALRQAKGYLRREVGQRVRLRRTPDLMFIWDASLDRVERINALIHDLDIPPAPPEEDDFDESASMD
ncbi:MAG: 30S ribosome-binding factor RbfA [Anaerolineae bacterium]|nr:30S ribosome-binding factor RbfA [Anaerolineae bacterium]